MAIDILPRNRYALMAQYIRRFNTWLLTTCLLFAVFAMCDMVFAQDKAGDQEDRFQPGLVGTYRTANHSIQRIDDSISFIWRKQSPDKQLVNTKFNVSWKGYLHSHPGLHRIDAFAAGQVRITLNGQVLLDKTAEEAQWLTGVPMKLAFDWHPLEVEYDNTGNEAELRLFWSSPTFPLTPITPHDLFHNPQNVPPNDFQHGELLTRVLRCAVCHHIPGTAQPRPAPVLDHLKNNIHHPWLIEWLVDDRGDKHVEIDGQQTVLRKMPSFGFSRDQATALAAYLLQQSSEHHSNALDPEQAKVDEVVRQGNSKSGHSLFMTLGCLACHSYEDLGNSNLFGGGDLTQIAEKRPANFFGPWLTNPQQINPNHRMPVFDLQPQEHADLVAFLSSSGTPQSSVHRESDELSDLIRHGQKLFNQFRCNTCHYNSLTEPPVLAVSDRIPLSSQSNWEHACTGKTDFAKQRPGYQLQQPDRQAIQHFVNSVISGHDVALNPSFLLAENNCLSCHARNGQPGIANKLPAVIKAYPNLEKVVPWMIPPALATVGDKLNDTALKNAIRLGTHEIRPWLHIRMPKFPLTEKETETLVQGLVQVDRIPKDHPYENRDAMSPHSEASLEIAGRRLVTSNGFSCMSCHQVGQQQPVQTLPGALGPNLNLLEKRIRQPWFYRFVKNPARFFPNMEMPSVQQPVHGVLNDNLDAQLAAVWHVLNRPGFEPPDPHPQRVLRRSGKQDQAERPVIVTDVLHNATKIVVKPLLIGMPNRHNVLFDLETNQFQAWTVGDVAQQHTQHKSWYWSLGGTPLFQTTLEKSDLALLQTGQLLEPLAVGQFVTEIDSLQHKNGSVVYHHRLHFGQQDQVDTVLTVSETISMVRREHQSPLSGIRRTIAVQGCSNNDLVLLRLLSPVQMGAASISNDSRKIEMPTGNAFIRLVEPGSSQFKSDGTIILGNESQDNDFVSVTLEYCTTVAVDLFSQQSLMLPAAKPKKLNVVPGFHATRLPIDNEIMPTGLAWQPDGTLVVSSLKGRVWLARDTDGDSLEDTLIQFSDELAAPFGLAAYDNYIDVINKYALLRLFDEDKNGHAEAMITLASGWGHTTDYHDWSVGLPRDEQGNYFIVTGSRNVADSVAGDRGRGKALKLIPRDPTANDPRQFQVEEMSGGFRFPIGIARSQNGDLFITDNQGNYNPFNELNHLIPRTHYGYYSPLDIIPEQRPPPVPPAVKIPHPWTRSVNGICFLYTPAAVKGQLDKSLFGPFEGHLVGCEYDTRRLIRMSLERIGSTIQGAVYPFSANLSPDDPQLLGPLTCAVSPHGDLMVGCIRDSGWGGSNNHGSLVRLQPDSDSLPPGIAEVRALADGFVLDLIGPVNATLATDPENYIVSSYTRISTAAYENPDQQRQVEKILDVSWDETRRQARVKLASLREGFVYEFHLKNLAGEDIYFFPAEAHYNLLTIPD